MNTTDLDAQLDAAIALFVSDLDMRGIRDAPANEIRRVILTHARNTGHASALSPDVVAVISQIAAIPYGFIANEDVRAALGFVKGRFTHLTSSGKQHMRLIKHQLASHDWHVTPAISINGRNRRGFERVSPLFPRVVYVWRSGSFQKTA